ncbi:MAG TPA: CBS domain-containing protein [Rhizobacter sp.]
MPTIASVITRNVVVVRPDETLQRAAELMNRLDVGALPVYDGTGLVGIVTDRDITVRATACNKRPDETLVHEVMSEQTLSCSEHDEIDDVARRMGEAQVRRLPVLSREGEIVGIVSLGDLATRQESEDLDETLRDISQPGDQAIVLA